MRNWTQLHPRQWPEIIRVIMPDDDHYHNGRGELDMNNCTEIWQHRVGYYLVRMKQTKVTPKKYWLFISPANGELLGDWIFNATKKKPPIPEANKIIGERLLDTRMP